MGPAARRTALFLALGHFASSSACVSGATRAEERRELIRVAMTREEVVKVLGQPPQKTPLDPAHAGGASEVWSYTYRTEPNTAMKVVLGVLVIGAVAAAVAGGGNPGGSIGGSGGGDLWEFKVYFGEDGRVRSITDVRPVPKR